MSHSRSDPDFWMYETSGVLRPAVVAYLQHGPLTAEAIEDWVAMARKEWVSPL